jgi:hypothetical protein
MTYLPPWLKIVFICTPHLGSPLAAGLLGRFGRDLIFAPVELMKSVDNLAATSIATALRKKGRIFRNTFGFRTAAQLKKSRAGSSSRRGFDSLHRFDIANQDLTMRAFRWAQSERSGLEGAEGSDRSRG